MIPPSALPPLDRLTPADRRALREARRRIDVAAIVTALLLLAMMLGRIAIAWHAGRL